MDRCRGKHNFTALTFPREKSGCQARCGFNFIARKVFLVLGTEDGKPVTVHVLLNGKPVDKGSGADVKNGMLTVDHEALV